MLSLYFFHQILEGESKRQNPMRQQADKNDLRASARRVLRVRRESERKETGVNIA